MRAIGVRLSETVVGDQAALARALYSWAIMIADEATAAALEERRTVSQTKKPPASP